MEASGPAPLPDMWLHSCHSETPRAVPVERSGRSIAANFDLSADHSATRAESRHAPLGQERMLGYRCHLDRTTLFAESAQGLLPIVNDFFMAEISWHGFRSDVWKDMAVVAIVPPKNDLGIRGTAAFSAETAGIEGWFILLQGLHSALDVMDLLSLRGCLRNDIEDCFTIQTDQLLGEGAYASVFHVKARDGSSAAVKHMNATQDFDSVAREVSALVECQGANVIRLRGVFWRAELPEVTRFSLMCDLAGDGDLLFKVFQTGAMPETYARPIFVGILNGLQRIHACGIVHRDVKTENILLKGHVPLVADFGLACKTSDVQQMSRRCGSAGFVAPEVCLGTPYDFKVDTFGAGVILYFMLSKELPFSSPDQDSAATMRKTVKCSLHLQRPPFNEMSSRVRNMLRQLICKNQDDRLSAEGALEQSWILKTEKSSGSVKLVPRDDSGTKKKEKALELDPPEHYAGDVGPPPPAPRS